MKQWWKSKTIWVAILTTIIGIADFLQTAEFTWQNAAFITVGIVQVVLRTITNTGLTVSTPEDDFVRTDIEVNQDKEGEV